VHEFSLMADIVRKIESTARSHNAAKVTEVSVTLGALCHMSADHFREHFEHGVRGTIAEGARLRITESSDTDDLRADQVILDAIETED